MGIMLVLYYIGWKTGNHGYYIIKNSGCLKLSLTVHDLKNQDDDKLTKELFVFLSIPECLHLSNLIIYFHFIVHYGSERFMSLRFYWWKIFVNNHLFLHLICFHSASCLEMALCARFSIEIGFYLIWKHLNQLLVQQNFMGWSHLTS